VKLRRFLGALLAVVVAVGVTVVGAPAAQASTCATLGPLAVPACGAFWGFAVDGGSGSLLASDENTVGRPFDIVYDFHTVGDTLPTADERNEVASGHLLHVNIESRPYTYASIASGAEDALLIKQAQGVASLNAPVYVTFEHEPDVKTKVSRGTPAQFVAAWQHVHDLFEANGATNSLWVWVTTGWYLNIPRYAELYPGNSYVDWISWEAYSTTSCGTGRNPLTSTFADAAGPVYQWLHNGQAAAAGIDVSKPEMISEYGANYDSGNPGAQGAWYQGIPQALKTQFPDIKAVTKWDTAGGNCRYAMTTSPQTTAGVVAGGQDPFVNPSTVDTTPTGPSAAFTIQCLADTCTLDGSGSSSSAGISSYSWDFGDASDPGTDPAPVHTFPADAPYPVTLTVTDGNGATASVTQTVTTPPPAPVAAFTKNCSASSCSVDATSSSSAESPITSYSWDFGDGATATGATASHAYTPGTSPTTFPITLTVTDAATDQNSTSQSVLIQPVPQIAFKAAVSTNGNAKSESVKVPSSVTAGNGMLLIATGASSTALTGPAGWTKVDTATASPLTSTLWRKVATATDAGSTVAVTFPAVEHGTVQLLAYSGTSATNPVAAYAKSQAAGTATKYTTPTINASAAGALTVSYWGCKSSTVTRWTTPSGQTVRSTAYGTGGGRITSAVSESGPGSGGPTGGYTATPDTSASGFAAWTIVLG
jgi:PKD repeat protein